ncbi:MAG: PRTRC system protein F [Azoarcus sp.]|jgi:PRTRC genetic system protein F|nr:PRTRC system protein F [Azoarcus sp.]
MTAFVLPRIDARVPPRVTPARTVAANGDISEFLLDADVLSPSDIPSAWRDSLDACEQTLARWINREIGPLSCLTPVFSLNILRRGGGYDDAPSSPGDCEALEIGWWEGDIDPWPIGAGLEALARQARGLGAIVLHVLDRQSRLAYPLFTPAVAHEVASMLYWYGENDEEAALDMSCEEGDEAAREAMRAEMVTRALIASSSPAWAHDWPRGLALPYCARHLRRALKTLTDPTARRIAENALALSLLRFENDYLPEAEGEFIGFGGVLAWLEDDVTVRVYDDLVNAAYQGEFCETMGTACFGIDAPASFGQWQRDMKPRFQAISLIDRLIRDLSM